MTMSVRIRSRIGGRVITPAPSVRPSDCSAFKVVDAIKIAATRKEGGAGKLDLAAADAVTIAIAAAAVVIFVSLLLLRHRFKPSLSLSLDRRSAAMKQQVASCYILPGPEGSGYSTVTGKFMRKERELSPRHHQSHFLRSLLEPTNPGLNSVGLRGVAVVPRPTPVNNDLSYLRHVLLSSLRIHTRPTFN